MPNFDKPADSKKEEKRAITKFLNAVLEGNENLPPKTRKSLEGEEQKIINHNLELMRTQMQDLSASESMGGNAGGITIEGQRYTCVGLNGQADRETGKIFLFANFQSVPTELRRISIDFTFREAVNVFNTQPESHERKIVNFYGADRFSEKARKTIEACIEIYNRDNWK